ncbi:ribonucleoside-diphosphate reductase, adenosylcobalamin-dependent [Candidatus Peregrinibacteria bacterium CG_4_10_14_0_2_um_filter_38_24]|nr:MAG: ribonucleoside-diphosphate reductase, adenosylcobalamin-dependent [Candidatus Peregrinibacteria bacterium CG_4_10_14_0_2_um_filter_38_24]PJC38531.1 MAG: ribonucleoside-diphosphate reductase, adenosylcobalamin-dependent [Candidatus Peregrinibacteria bacterium CG_4_9_14_0_2_um_filter_38_9]
MSPIKKIKKRNGDVVEFDQAKITEAIWKAANSVGGGNTDVSAQISNQVTAVLEVFFKDESNIPTVEQIQDLVEKILIEGGHAKTAKAYILYREQHKNIRYKQEEILNGKTTKLPFSINALRVLAGRYLQRNEKGEVTESPEEMFSRVAGALASVEKQYGKSEQEIEEFAEKFRDILYNFEFIPAGRTLANAGGKTKLVANCIVLHAEDSMRGIFDTLRDASLLQQAGSGLGFPWHILRPAGTRASATQGVASGPVSFMKVYNEAFSVIKQQGRHGANMGVMRIDHPDILEFIESKWEEGSFVNFNISVALTDKFMQQVEEGSKEPWMCTYKDKEMKPRRIIRNKRSAFVEAIEETITASELMDKIINSAWRNGEPGVLFPDAANRTNPIPALGRLEATNPCGEQWLHDGDVCNLGSVNLSKFVKDGKIEEERLKHVVKMAVRLLDNVIDISDFPVEKINKVFRNNRRVGLGIMGFADMLYQLKVPYDSEQGFATGKRVMHLINVTAHDYSEEIAKEKGTFPNWEISIFGPKEKNRKQRNAALTTVAPTGSISMLLDCGSGVEPFFALSFQKEVMSGQKLMYLNSFLEAELKTLNLYNDTILKEIERTGSIQHITEIPENIRKVYVTAMDISAEAHIRMQAAFQSEVDNSISKTINFPYSATREDVRQGYIMAWKADLKGCTVYRDGSRKEQVLTITKDTEEQKKETNDTPCEISCETCEATEQIELKQNFEEVIPPPVGNTDKHAEHNHDPRAHMSLSKNEIIKSRKCPECSNPIQIAEGCMLCLSCGFSACSA